MDRTYSLPSPNAPTGTVPRRVPEGTVPLVAFEGDAYECGRAYGDLVQARYPGYDNYLRQAAGWCALPLEVGRLVERRAPYVLDLYRGLQDSVSRGPAAERDTSNKREVGATNSPTLVPGTTPAHADSALVSGTNATHGGATGGAMAREGCTSFAVSGTVTLEGHPIAGQTKDVGIVQVPRYIVLRLRLKDAPTILVLAYPGEVLGLGLWSTGMTIFRNSLYSTADCQGTLTMWQWGLLALAGSTVHEAVELAERHGIAGQGSLLISDKNGDACSVEFNAGGVSPVWAKDGVATHGNHPEGAKTTPFENLEWDASERENSRYRMHGLWSLLDAERGRLTPQRAMALLGDHTYYPQGICRHWIAGEPESETVAAAVAEPTLGRLHVVRGQPCCNWPVTYTL